MALLTLAVLAAALVGVLWAITPSVGDAAHRVAVRNHADGAAYPGTVPPAKVIDALVATEDADFFSNPGIAPRGVARGAVGVLTHSANAGGATLEQQLAKVLYTGGRSGPVQIPEQLTLAVKLDARYTKAQILRLYLSTVYFGDGAYGLDAATSHYFDLRPDQLSWAQASLLAGLVQAPSAYDPLTHLTLGKQRQRHVLNRLVATGHLTAAQANAVYADPLHLTGGGDAVSAPPPLPGVFHTLAPVLDRHGYLAVAGFVFLEDFGVPVPGETIRPPNAAAACQQ